VFKDGHHRFVSVRLMDVAELGVKEIKPKRPDGTVYDPDEENYFEDPSEALTWEEVEWRP